MIGGNRHLSQAYITSKSLVWFVLQEGQVLAETCLYTAFLVCVSQLKEYRFCAKVMMGKSPLWDSIRANPLNLIRAGNSSHLSRFSDGNIPNP